jgi:hypothetical protein
MSIVIGTIHQIQYSRLRQWKNEVLFNKLYMRDCVSDQTNDELYIIGRFSDFKYRFSLSLSYLLIYRKNLVATFNALFFILIIFYCLLFTPTLFYYLSLHLIPTNTSKHIKRQQSQVNIPCVSFIITSYVLFLGT